MQNSENRDRGEIVNMERICSEKGCTLKHYSLGYCCKHYGRFKRTGTTDRLVEDHGMDGNPIYKTWISLRARCNNPKDKDYSKYGGRGISVCDRWDKSFISFYEDMGDRPFPKAQIDRIENNKGYYKDNCRWATSGMNNRNRSTTKLNWNNIFEIRDLSSNKIFTDYELGIMYGVGRKHINDIVNKKRWTKK